MVLATREPVHKLTTSISVSGCKPSHQEYNYCCNQQPLTHTQQMIYDCSNKRSLKETLNINLRTCGTSELKKAIQYIDYRPKSAEEFFLSKENDNTAEFKKKNFGTDFHHYQEQIKNKRADIPHKQDKSLLDFLQPYIKNKLRIIKSLAIKTVLILLGWTCVVLNQIPRYWLVLWCSQYGFVHGADDPPPPSNMELTDSADPLTNDDQDNEINQNTWPYFTGEPNRHHIWGNDDDLLPHSIDESLLNLHNPELEYVYKILYLLVFFVIFFFICQDEERNRFLQQNLCSSNNCQAIPSVQTDTHYSAQGEKASHLTQSHTSTLDNQTQDTRQCCPPVTGWRRRRNTVNWQKRQHQFPPIMPRTQINTDLHPITHFRPSSNDYEVPDLMETLVKVIYPESKHADPNFVKEFLVPSWWTLDQVIKKRICKVGTTLVPESNHNNFVINVVKSYDDTKKCFIKCRTDSMTEDEMNQRIGNQMMTFIISLPELPESVNFFRKAKK